MATKIFLPPRKANTKKVNHMQDVLSSSTNTRIIINNQSTFFRTGQKFQNAADQLDKKLLHKKQIEVAVVLYKIDSVVLKLYKKSWANPHQDPLTSASRIFFSVWMNESVIKEQKLLYNIHALKLRQLKGYHIQSRKFADIFRNSFKAFAHTWENINVKVGPLTLMEGWLKTNPENLHDNILKLANGFLEIEYLVDDTLAQFKWQ